MKKCIILLPLEYNHGTEVPSGVINSIKREIDEAFDGHTVGGKVKGTYRMADGHMQSDVSLEIWVVVDSEGLDILRKMASRFARMLKQETIYFEVTDSEVEFIGPDRESEGA